MSRPGFFAIDPVRQNVIVVAIVFAFLASAGYYWLFPAMERVENDAIRSQRAMVEGSVKLLDLFFDLTFETLEEFGAQHSVDLETHFKFHGVFFETRKDFLSIVATDEKGNLTEPPIAREGIISSFIGIRSIPEAAFFREAIKGNKYISPVFFGAKGPTLHMAVPIRKEGRISGVVAAEIDFTLMREAVDKVMVESGKIYIVDERGTIISDPDPERSRSGDNLRFRSMVEALTVGRKAESFGGYLNEKKEAVLAYGARMPLTGWGVVVEQAEKEVLQQRNQTLMAASIFTASGFVLTLLLALNTLRLRRALSSIKRERQEKERVIEYLPDGVIEYTGENQILTMNPAAKRYLDIKDDAPVEFYVTESAAPLPGFERLWHVFFPRHKTEGGQGNIYEIEFLKPERRILQIITVYIKGTGPLPEQRYLKIIHDVTHER